LSSDHAISTSPPISGRNFEGSMSRSLSALCHSRPRNHHKCYETTLVHCTTRIDDDLMWIFLQLVLHTSHMIRAGVVEVALPHIPLRITLHTLSSISGFQLHGAGEALNEVLRNNLIYLHGANRSEDVLQPRFELRGKAERAGEAELSGKLARSRNSVSGTRNPRLTGPSWPVY
jgi:hypothetical protein